MRTIGSVEFDNFILKGVKGVQGLEKLKEYRIMRVHIDRIAQAHIGNDLTMNADAKIFVKALEKTDKETATMITELMVKLNANQLAVSTMEEGEKKVELEGQIAQAEKSIKEFIALTIQQHPDMLKEFLSQEVTYELEKSEEIEKATSVLFHALRLCLESLGKKPEIVNEWSNKNMEEFMMCIVEEKENLVDYKDVFFSIPRVVKQQEQSTESVQ